MSIEHSLELLEDGADGQLDPELVRVFEDLWTSGRLGNVASQEMQACVR